MHADATNRMQQMTRDLHGRPAAEALLRDSWRWSRTRFAGSCVYNKTAKIRFALSFFVPQGPAKAPGAGVRDLTGPVPRGTLHWWGRGLSCRERSPALGCRKASTQRAAGAAAQSLSADPGGS